MLQVLSAYHLQGVLALPPEPKICIKLIIPASHLAKYLMIRSLLHLPCPVCALSLPCPCPVPMLHSEVFIAPDLPRPCPVPMLVLGVGEAALRPGCGPPQGVLPQDCNRRAAQGQGKLQMDGKAGSGYHQFRAVWVLCVFSQDCGRWAAQGQGRL